MSNIIQTFPRGGNSTYAGLPDKPTVNDIDIETLSIEGMDVVEDTTNNVTEISAPGLNADSLADVTSGEVGNNFATSAFNYSTNEQIVGKWIDGKPIYQKTINTGELPNGTGKEIEHGIANLKRIIHMEGYCYGATANNNRPMPFSSASDITKNIQLLWNSTKISITTGSNLTLFTESYVTLQYTKTTDT